MNDPHYLHFAAVQRIIRYFHGTPNQGLYFSKNSNIQLIPHSDVDWAGCLDSRRSTTGWCMFLSKSLIFWKCKNHEHTFKSSTEAWAMSSAYSEIIWL